MPAEFEVILLAAGLSRRMGNANKLLLRFGETSLITRVAGRYCALGLRVTVVLGHEADGIRATLGNLPLKTVLNSDYVAGQDSSILTGLGAIHADGPGVLMSVGDLPLLETSDISQLCDAFLKSARDRIFMPCHNGQRGHPVILPADIARDLKATMSLPRTYMTAHPGRVKKVNTLNAHYTTDLDTQDDMTRLNEDLRLH